MQTIEIEKKNGIKTIKECQIDKPYNLFKGLF